MKLNIEWTMAKANSEVANGLAEKVAEALSTDVEFLKIEQGPYRMRVTATVEVSGALPLHNYLTSVADEVQDDFNLYSVSRLGGTASERVEIEEDSDL